MDCRTVRDKRFSEMVRFIEAQIAAGAYRPGDRLPPLRHWCGEFELRLNAARRGMWDLRDRGLVECRRGAGVYVRDFDRPQEDQPRIALVYSEGDPALSYCAHALLGIRQAGRRRNLSFSFSHVKYSQRCSSFEPMPELNDCQSVIMLGNYDRAEADYSWLRRPAVGVEMHRMYGGLFSVVSMDPVNAAELAADYFLKHGRKHVKILDGLAPPLHRFRAQVFQDIFEDAGGSAEFLPSSGEALDFRDRDCGYLCAGGAIFEQQAKLFPGDLAHERCVIALDAKSEILPNYTPVTTIGPDWRQIGVLALEEAVRRGKHPGSMGKRIYADVKLIER